MNRTEALIALEAARLYAILDTGYSDPMDWPRLTGEFIRGGVGILQIRAKGSPKEDILRWTDGVHPLTQAAGIPLIINDHPELVPLTGAEGFHIGQDDGSIAEARCLAGPESLAGKSTHTPAQAEAAAEEEPDYLGFGPVFATPTKPDYIPIGPEAIQTLSGRIRIPVFCIGGIKLGNIQTVVRMGARRVVMVSGLLEAADPAATARAVLATLATDAA